MAHLGLPEPLILPLGILERSCVVIYLIPATSIVGAILGICVWLGLYLRDKRLRDLIPLRTSVAVDCSGSPSTRP
jgi:hypothetical protein